MAAILLVDDEAMLRQSMAISLRRDGHLVAEAGSRAEAFAAIERDVFDLVLIDLRLPDGDGLTLLREMRAQSLDVVALVVTAFGTIENAVEAMRLGAYDFLQKPFGPERLEACILRALEHRRLKAELRRRADVEIAFAEDPTASIVGESAALVEVRRLVRQAAASRVVLVTGETGTGKDLVARAVHAAAGDPDAPFVAVNCGGLPESLVESELFGHVRGAFTGASGVRRGLFAEAEGGTLFLDEIGDVPPGLQPRLLRFLESGEVRAVGADHTSHVTCRIIAATHRDLTLAVREGRLRQDLLYRLDVFRIAIPPLRERPQDIEPLATRFLMRISRRLRRPPLRLEPGAIEAMQAWSWPGNVRELEHALERAALLTEADELPVEMVVPEPALEAPAGGPSATGPRSMAEVERAHILAVLDECGGDLAGTARALGISRSTLRRKLAQYGSE